MGSTVLSLKKQHTGSYTLFSNWTLSYLHLMPGAVTQGHLVAMRGTDLGVKAAEDTEDAVERAGRNPGG